jgi:hypothetical protein
MKDPGAFAGEAKGTVGGAVSKAAGRTLFYYNPKTGKSMWDPPPSSGSSGDGGDASSNTLFAESAPGKGDYRPFNLRPGFGVRFNGHHCRHFTVPNSTDRTRVSIDFRVVPLSLWKEGAHGGYIGDYKSEVMKGPIILFEEKEGAKGAKGAKGAATIAASASGGAVGEVGDAAAGVGAAEDAAEGAAEETKAAAGNSAGGEVEADTIAGSMEKMSEVGGEAGGEVRGKVGSEAGKAGAAAEKGMTTRTLRLASLNCCLVGPGGCLRFPVPLTLAGFAVAFSLLLTVVLPQTPALAAVPVALRPFIDLLGVLRLVVAVVGAWALAGTPRSLLLVVLNVHFANILH